MRPLTSAQEWQRIKLGRCFKIKHGFAFKGEFFSSRGPYVLLTPGNFREKGGLKLKGDKEKYYTGSFPEEFLLRKGDLLIAMTDLKQSAPILGSTAFVQEDEKFLHNQRLGKIVDLNEQKMDKMFLFYLFNTSEIRGQIKGSATGSTVRHTAPDRIYVIETKIPPLPTQRKIASILSAYDDLIENNTRRIEILEGMAQAIYREWFVHFRFPGHEKVGMVDSPLGEVPEGWEVVELNDMCHIVMGQSPKSEYYNEEGRGLPFHQGVTNFGHRFPTDKISCTIENRIAEAGDILFSVRAPVGRINLATKRIVIGRGLAAIRSKAGDQAFVFQQLKEKFQEEDSMGGGTIFKAVTKSDMLGIKLLQPEATVISQFEEFAKPIFTQLENLTTKNDNLRRTRDLLLPRLISGEVSVEDTEIDYGEIDNA